MRNRKFLVDHRLVNYTVKAPKLYVYGHQEIDVKKKACLGIFEDKTGKKTEKTVNVFSLNMPVDFTVGEDSTKVQPEKVLSASRLNALYKDPKLISLDLLNKGAQLCMTIGKKNPQNLESHLPLLDIPNDGYYINTYRVMAYRYDQVKNDFFAEIVIARKFKDHPNSKLSSIHCYIPIKMLAGDKASFEKDFEAWATLASNESAMDAGDARDFLYKLIFNARRDSDFPDKSTKKYAQFTKLRKSFNYSERHMGNTVLGVFLAMTDWFWKTYGRNKLENDMMGYFGKKYMSLYMKFMEHLNTPKLIPNNDFEYYMDRKHEDAVESFDFG